MSTRTAAARLMALIEACALDAGLEPPAMSDEPGSVLAPCLLFTPPDRTYDTLGGPLLTWRILALAPPPATGSSWDVLDDLEAHVGRALPIRGADVGSIALPGQGPDPLPALFITYEETLR